MRKALHILLATYNAGRFLREQLDSLLAQTDGDFEVLVSDGGSADATVGIVREYAARDGRIRLVATERAGAVANFARLWKAADADYVMFCDHDDVWCADKVAKSMDAMRRAEAAAPGMPIAVFHDARVVDAGLGEIAPSSFARQGLDPHRTALRQLLMQNVAAGNTLCANRALRERVGEIPDDAVMHDHWVMLAAAAFGRIVLLDEPLLLYRQHGANVLGASAFSARGLAARLAGGVGKAREKLYRHVDQAAEFLARYRPLLRAEDVRMLEAFAGLRRRTWLGRRLVLLRHGIFKCGIVRNIGTLALI